MRLVLITALIATASPALAFQPKIVAPPCVEARHAGWKGFEHLPVCGSPEALPAFAKQREQYTPAVISEESVCYGSRCVTWTWKEYER